jgi:hypothetical protein
MAASHPLPEPVSHGRRLTALAAAHPDQDAIVYAAPDGAERRVSWAELDRRSSQVARLLAARGVGEGATVAVGLPNCPEHFLACFAAWKLGALALPLRAALPAPERDALLALARPALVVAEWGDLPYPTLSPADLDRAADYPDGPLPDRVPHPGRAVASGGATGRPKLIVATVPGLFDPDEPAVPYLRPGDGKCGELRAGYAKVDRIGRTPARPGVDVHPWVEVLDVSVGETACRRELRPLREAGNSRDRRGGRGGCGGHRLRHLPHLPRLP